MEIMARATAVFFFVWIVTRSIGKRQLSELTAFQLVLRGYYLRRLFRGFRILRQLARAVAPTIPAAALVLGVRGVAL